MRCIGKKYRKKDLCFIEKCKERKREMKEALRKFKEKDDNKSRVRYWERRKAYERTAEKKPCLRQEKVAQHINKLHRKKLRLYGKPYGILREEKKEPLISVKPHLTNGYVTFKNCFLYTVKRFWKDS
jgi:hypothetical protein